MSSFMVYRAYAYSLNHSVCVCVYENLSVMEWSVCPSTEQIRK